VLQKYTLSKATQVHRCAEFTYGSNY